VKPDIILSSTFPST